jgi:hypothetical protein
MRGSGVQMMSCFLPVQNGAMFRDRERTEKGIGPGLSTLTHSMTGIIRAVLITCLRAARWQLLPGYKATWLSGPAAASLIICDLLWRKFPQFKLGAHHLDL